MKTITLKADNEFNDMLNQLTMRLHTNRSDVIRKAVKNLSEHLDKEMLRKKIKSASLKTRAQAIQASDDFEIANNDGL
ncbi:MAG: DNA-binding protein [Gammaproteobacteria bacterium]|nr:DNA-binding protein [Gammaproteobacteria bacterium]